MKESCPAVSDHVFGRAGQGLCSRLAAFLVENMCKQAKAGCKMKCLYSGHTIGTRGPQRLGFVNLEKFPALSDPPAKASDVLFMQPLHQTLESLLEESDPKLPGKNEAQA